MVDTGADADWDRARLGWWAFVLALAAAAAFITYSFVGLAALGVFGYYATRPIYRELQPLVDSDAITAFLTVTVVLLPVVALIIYTGFRLYQRFERYFGGPTEGPLIAQYLGAVTPAQRQALQSLLTNPQQFIRNPGGLLQTVLNTGLTVLTAVFGALVLIALAVTLSYFLLENDDALAEALVELFGGRDTTAYAYALAVDDDLESIFFGNFVFVVVMSVIAAIAYWGTNYFAPQGLSIPIVFALSFLTGIASLIPIVVGKVVYLPVTAYLGLQAMRTPGSQLAFVGGALVVYFLVLDILPQTFLQPYITGHNIDVVMMIFAYLLGPILFGWYGVFLMPIIFILVLETVRIVLPKLVHGKPLDPGVELGDTVGSVPPLPREMADDAEEFDREDVDARRDDGGSGDDASTEGD